MTVSPLGAAQAYARAATRAVAGAADPRPAEGPDFADLVRDAAKTTSDSLKRGEAASLAAVTGKADIAQVVTAVSNAEVTLQAAVAVRDKVIQAYLDVIRMPI